MIDSDEPDVKIVLKKKDGSDDIDYAEGTKTPTENGKYAELLVPYGKYKITLIRTQAPKRSRRTAYRGVLDFTEKKEHKYLRTWMVPTTEAMRFIGAEATFLPNYASAAPRGFTVPLRANLIELPLCKGLSTSMTEAAALYTKGYVEVPEGLPENHYLDLMPAISGPFMNYDFRLGGGFCQYADISLAVSYTYYLHFDRLLEKWVKDYSGAFDHFEGHDVFFGLEIASRFKSINCYVRAGLQYLKGDRMYYHVAEDYESVTSTMPTEMSKFVVTVGFNIGAAGAKGQNILRVF